MAPDDASRRSAPSDAGPPSPSGRRARRRWIDLSAPEAARGAGRTRGPDSGARSVARAIALPDVEARGGAPERRPDPDGELLGALRGRGRLDRRPYARVRQARGA